MEVERVAEGGKKTKRGGDEEQASEGLRDALPALPLDAFPRSAGKSSSWKMAVARNDVGVPGHTAAHDTELEAWDGGSKHSSLSPPAS